jgi:thiol-disulfide isomerase/thioredoxin
MRCGYFEENFPLLARQLATAEFITPACYATMLTSVLFIVCLFGALSFGAAISTKSCSLQSILGSDVSSTLVQAPLPTSSLLKVAMMRAGASSKTVRDISSPAEFDKLLQSAGKGKLVVVDFTATWCGPCKMISPMYQQLSELYTKAVFVKVSHVPWL